MRFRFVSLTAACVAMIGAAVAAADISTGEIKRLDDATTVVRALRDQPDKGIPEKLWQNAACVVIIPNLKKAALGIGGEYGKGVMSCRTGEKWSAPLFMQLAKGSWGAQIGAAEIDLVLLVMNRNGAEKLLKNKVSLGADASVAAGPVGRDARAGTDLQLKSEILAYSRAQGLFAGIDISGGVLQPDDDDNKDAYGSAAPRDVLHGSVQPPAGAAPLMTALRRANAGS